MERIYDGIARLLGEAFRPQELVIEDDSHKHEGHAGSREGGETHFRVTLVSPVFAGQSRVARQREVMKVLKPLDRIHAIQLFVYTPEEYAAR